MMNRPVRIEADDAGLDGGVDRRGTERGADEAVGDRRRARAAARRPRSARRGPWRRSAVKLPVMSVEPPRMPTSQPTPVLTSGEEMTSPSRTIAMRRLGSPVGLQAALPVMSAQVSPPLPLKSIATTHSTLWSRWTALAPVISSPWMTVGPTSRVSPWSDGRTWLPSLVGFGVGLGGREDLVDRQLGGGADALLGLLRLLVAGDARQLDEDPVLALAHQRGLGDAEGVHAAAQHLRGSCRRSPRWPGSARCPPPRRRTARRRWRSRPRLGLTLIASARHPARRPSTRKKRTQTPRDMRDILY